MLPLLTTTSPATALEFSRTRIIIPTLQMKKMSSREVNEFVSVTQLIPRRDSTRIQNSVSLLGAQLTRSRMVKI